jgi:pimeloyl-ACP methyl ester carboxylesterase
VPPAWRRSLCRAEGEALDRLALGEVAGFEGPHHVDEDFLALAAYDEVDPGRLAQDLLVHERGVDAAEHAQGLGRVLLCELQNPLRRVNRGRDGRDADEVRLQFAKACGDGLIVEVVLVIASMKVNVVEARLAQWAGEVGYPGGWPVAGDFGATGLVVGVNEDYAHHFLSGKLFTPHVADVIYKRVTVPTLVLYDRDPNVGFERLEEVLAACPNWRAVRIPGTLGLPHFEQPVPTQEALEAFWAQPAPAT